MPVRHRLEPAAGRILHGAGQSAAAFTDYVAALPGTTPLLYMTYVGLDGAGMAAWADHLAADLAARPGYVIPQIGLAMSHDGSPDQHYEHRVAAGEFDADIEAFCQGLLRLGRPAMVRIGFEFNGQWNGYHADTFVAAWKRVAAAIRRHPLAEVALVWCYSPDGTDKDFARFYPGDDQVDWWSIDLFSDWHFTAPDTVAFMQAATAAGFPVLIGESTPRQVGVLDGDVSWQRWFAPYLAFIARWPQVKGISYIAWDWSGYPMWQDWGDGRPWRDPIVLERWRATMRQPRWVHAATPVAVRHQLGLAGPADARAS